ncbi:MAG: CocE/NonD family hydrolase, partial [Planctomycetaceae bacterium]
MCDTRTDRTRSRAAAGRGVRLARAAAVLAAVALHGSTVAADPPGPYGVTVVVDEMVAMRDGVKLATDVYRPTRDGVPLADRTAVVLIRTPYDKTAGKSPEGTFFASHGYTAVIQDTRGRYGSEGVWRWLVDDGPDGVDTAAWIAAQPWSDGRIGMMGTSYVGGTQHALAMAGSPHLKTVIPVDAVSNMGRQSMRNAGAFELRFWNWIILNAAKGSTASRDPARAAALEEMAAHRRDYLAHLPLRPGTTPLKFAPEYESWLVESMRHAANDDYWRQNAIVDHPDEYQDIPVYLVGGWYDSWAGNTTANYRALSRRLESDVYLIMGPWIHGGQGGGQHGQVSFGPDAAIAEPLTWRRRWFDRWLRDDESVVGREPPFRTKVRIFVMGTGSGRRNADGLL